jgi:DNA-binding response OmpR family regulator
MTRLLVADDSETILLLMQRRLAFEGYEVETVNGGRQVIDSIREASPDSAPDVIVLDAMMPGMSGFDVLRELRGMGDSTPVLMVSAHRHLDELREAERIGADGCMTKPIDWEELIARIEALTAPRA